MSHIPTMQTQTISCPSCRGELGSSDVNIETGLARCKRCDRAFRIEPRFAAEGASKEPVALPSGMSTEQQGSDLVIKRRWFGGPAVFLLFFCLFWDGILIFGFGFAGRGQRGLNPLLFAMPHFYIGIALTYYTLCLLVNKTTFWINPSRVRIEVGPLPAFGNKTIPAEKIDQLYCRKVVGSKGSVSYRLMMISKEGKSFAIGTNFQRREEVVYLEQQIEAALEIADRLVEGEVTAKEMRAEAVFETFARLFKTKPPKGL